MPQPDHPGSVCGIVVTHHPDLLQLDRALRAVQPQLAGLVIVDNGSTPDTCAAVDQLARSLADRYLPVLLALGRNLGVAAAHNCGIAHARQLGFDYVLLLDQDSEPAPDMVAHLLAAHRALASAGHGVAATGPVYVDRARGFTSCFVRLGWLHMKPVYCGPADEPVQSDFLISSGALIAMSALDHVGTMDEGLFIDYVDIEWFLRARSMGLVAFGVGQAVMRHSVGHDTMEWRLGRQRQIAIHSPLRHYYVYRNGLALMRRPYASLRWRLNDTFRLVGVFVFFLLFVPERAARLAMVCRGISDGLRGRSGPIPGAAPATDRRP